MTRRQVVAFLVIGSWIVASLFYYNNFNLMKAYVIETQMLTSGRPILHTEESMNGTEDYLINTPGCFIPNYAKTFKFIEAIDQKSTCGERAVFIDKKSSNITFRINRTLMKKHYVGNQGYECCYRFVSRSTTAGNEDTSVTYSQCKPFDDGTNVKLEEEVILVSCTTVPNKKLKHSNTFYEDAYMILKKLKRDTTVGEKPWNILILGMDTMSRARFLNSMPKAASFFNQHGWLDYKGYQKVGYNTFPNLMAFLTGKKMTTIYHTCAQSMDKCNQEIIWTKFQNFGYVTVYGEDFLRLPDTFSRYNGFKTQPTNHYMRPLFLTGETDKGNLICTKKMPSAVHALNYALDFVESYKNNKFFGMFWLNSYSHNHINLPTLLDEDLTIFLDKLHKTGALSNTFVFFLSDHGIRNGKMRLPVESYYEERLPMFFMWVPLDFRESHALAYYNLKLNQNRLATPYDLHETLENILQLSSDYVTHAASEACPNCTSLFQEKTKSRACASAGVDDKWCSCHNLISVDNQEYGAARSIELVASYIQNKSKSVITTKCMKCSPLQLKTVLRTHMHADNDNDNITNYVVALEMSPGDVGYEASVKEDENGFHIIQPTQTITEYNTRGNCVVSPNDREFCVCEKIKKCH